MILLILLACGGADLLSALAPPQADLTVSVHDAKVDAGEPLMVEVRTWAAPGWTVNAAAPSAEGLEAVLVDEQGPVQSGERTVFTRVYAMRGALGSYIIQTPAAGAIGPGEQERSFEPARLFVDIGVEGPNGGEMDGFASAPPPTRLPWGLIMAGVAIGLLAALIVLWLIHRWRASPAPVPPPPSPHVVAEAAWAEARAAGLDDHGLAVALSMVLRVYLEALGGFNATAATTREILDHLQTRGLGEIPFGIDDRMRMARILDATDRLKFAREGGGEAFFDALDADFHAIVGATRPGGVSHA